jgi:hypothetical protein
MAAVTVGRVGTIDASASIGVHAHTPTHTQVLAPAHPSEYDRVLPLAVWDIVVTSVAVAVPALTAFVMLSPRVGLVAVAFASAYAIAAAEYAVPWRIAVDDDGVTLYFWHRACTYDPRAIVVTHDVPCDRFVVQRRSGFPTFARFQDDDVSRALKAFVAAGVEVVSR